MSLESPLKDQHPYDKYDGPQDLADDDQLEHKERLSLLTEWEQSCLHCLIAEAEGMPAPRAAEELRAVRQAIQSLKERD